MELATHQGYAGGLDTNPKTLSNGRSSVYYSDTQVELMYHVVTSMPTKTGDPQQVGCDVWCEVDRLGVREEKTTE